jgi:hypothetical protein
MCVKLEIDFVLIPTNVDCACCDLLVEIVFAHALAEAQPAKEDPPQRTIERCSFGRFPRDLALHYRADSARSQ